MRQATTHGTQVLTPFGSGYIPEQRADETLWNLGHGDADNNVDEVVASLRVSMFSELMKSLRSSLFLG
jgi:hypothetical protein